MRCPKCKTNVEYAMNFKSLSKSGKTFYWYWYCEKCDTVFRMGSRVVKKVE